MATATETGLPAPDPNTETSSGQRQTTFTPFNPATVRQSYPPLTTEFSVRDVCRYLFSEDGQSVFPDGVTVSYSTSNRFDQGFASCQPSGWDSSYFQFSPAVCPSGWTYNQMRTVQPGVSRAFCCARYVAFTMPPQNQRKFATLMLMSTTADISTTPS